MLKRLLIWSICGLFPLAVSAQNSQVGKGWDLDKLPDVAEGFKVNFFAKEPTLLHPASLTFDRKGRMYVGHGPQFRKPSLETDADSILMLEDTDGDGVADKTKVFATGFSCIQALAWKGNDLWVANCPDITIVRDKDGDDVADEYELVFTGLGHMRHGLHGFNWAPDGKLYMSQGNSGAQKHAPQAFRDLMGIKSDLPDNQPLNKIFKASEYKKSYIGSWPSTEGGILRCDPGGKNLEIWSRGQRNAWDINFDDQFEWLGTDNDDGPEHDRIIAPFFGSHFGKRHAWSYSWTGKDNPPTVPMSGLFPKANGSGVGVIFYTAKQFPPEYRNVFLIGDWTDKSIFVFRRQWDGGLLNSGNKLPVLATANSNKNKSLFRPTDIEVGPDGALYALGWGQAYGSLQAPYGGSDKKAKMNEGRVFKIWYGGAPLIDKKTWYPPKRDKPLAQWTYEQLIEDLDHQVRVYTVDAQDELVRRGDTVVEALKKSILSGKLETGTQTWAMWALGRIHLKDTKIDQFFADLAAEAMAVKPINTRLQAIRILGYRIRERKDTKLPDVIATALKDGQPRIRLAAATAVRKAKDKSKVEALIAAAADETDRIASYAQWRGLGELAGGETLSKMLQHEKPAARRAAFLALAENRSISHEEADEAAIDADESVASVASLYLKKTGRKTGPTLALMPTGGDYHDPITIKASGGTKTAQVRYTTDGSMPTAKSKIFDKPIKLEKKDAVIMAALFRGNKRIGAILPARYHWITDEEWKRRLVITGLSKNNYKIIEGGFKVGAANYVDRKYTLKSVPSELNGATQIRTANDDSRKTDQKFLSFNISSPATVYLGMDTRLKAPAWLKDQGYIDTKLKVDTTDTSFFLYAKKFNGGQITLGGNYAGGSRGSMYLLALKKAGGSAVAKGPGTKADQVMPLIAKADAKAGEKLFFGKGGCFACHKVGDKGNALGPELSDIGLRAQSKFVTDSILDPNAFIIEGYLQGFVKTKDGKEYFGMLRDESALNLTIFQANGQAVSIKKTNVAEKKLLDNSAMPAIYAQLFNPKETADLVKYLMGQKKKLQ